MNERESAIKECGTAQDEALFSEWRKQKIRGCRHDLRMAANCVGTCCQDKINKRFDERPCGGIANHNPSHSLERTWSMVLS